MNYRDYQQRPFIRHIGDHVFPDVHEPDMRARDVKSPITLTRKLNKGLNGLVDLFSNAIRRIRIVVCYEFPDCFQIGYGFDM